MDTLIVNLDKSDDKARRKSALEMIMVIGSISDKIARSDIEEMADDTLYFLSVLVTLRLVKKQP